MISVKRSPITVCILARRGRFGQRSGCDTLPEVITSSAKSQTGEMAALLDMLAHASTRPRYAFMVLSLIAEVANADGEAGPFVKRDRQMHTLRDWLCDSLAPMGGRDPRRIALA
eukprot:gene10286-12606_t